VILVIVIIITLVIYKKKKAKEQEVVNLAEKAELENKISELEEKQKEDVEE
jgi:hypothetical protein